jgi:2-polyprenyl-3-methyl-5-hydroxy-6-metoxy-1,4-benzoquinol methylase
VLSFSEVAAKAEQRRVHTQIERHLTKVRRAIAKRLIKIACNLSAVKNYEPVEIAGKRFRSSRDTDTRWSVISQVLQGCTAENVLDIGCAEGWLLRRAAVDLGCFGLGIEASHRELTGELARLYDGIERIAVLKARVAPADIRKLPRFDAVICLSVVHHVIRRNGLRVAEEFIRALASRARKILIFEMGTSDERKRSWSNQLPDMPEGQEVFVRTLLASNGFTNIRIIGESEAFHGAKRLLFAAEPLKRDSDKVRRRSNGSPYRLSSGPAPRVEPSIIISASDTL